MSYNRIRVELTVMVDPGRGVDIPVKDVYGQPHTSLCVRERRFVVEGEVVEQVREVINELVVRMEAGLVEALPVVEPFNPSVLDSDPDSVLDSSGGITLEDAGYMKTGPRDFEG
jgi:hypothetical protein